MPYLAKSLVQLRGEINARWPNRDHESDGWIGDADHQTRQSDHNPDAKGCVHAIDVDKDGIDPNFLVKKAIAHPATNYVIYNRTIWSRSHGFSAREYTGTNPHTGHVHVSILRDENAENNPQEWGVWTVTAPTRPSSTAPGSRVLYYTQPMMRGEDVKFVQRFIGPKHMGKPDGIAGPKFEEGVKWYQRMRGITADGKVGKQTFGQMGVRWLG